MHTIARLALTSALLAGTLAMLGAPLRAQTSDTVTTASGLKYVMVKHGTGAMPQSGNFVIVHYTGTLANGSVFDDSRKRNEPFAFQLGTGTVIKGWDEGIALLHVGDRAHLIIPPALGYGEKGAGQGAIPPNATLTFDVELMDIKEKTVGSELVKTIGEKGIPAAQKQYAAMKKRGFAGYYLSETELNAAGYRFLQADKTKEALAIFKMNADAFPKSANVYDSLAEGCMMAGDKERAIYNYEKSLKLDPENKNAVAMLKKLRGE